MASIIAGNSTICMAETKEKEVKISDLKIAEKVLKKGPWPKFFFTKGGKGGIARKTYLTNVGGKLPTNLWLHSDVGHTDEANEWFRSR